MSEPSIASVQPSMNADPTAAFDTGSFRDPGGRVFERGTRIFRTVSHSLADDFGWVIGSGLLDRLIATGQVVRTSETTASDPASSPSTWKVFESERIPYISYPYEWPFAALKRAALFHLDLHLAVLERGGTLVDASAYNVQFRGPEPIFIDILSFRRYRDGDLWEGHRQFCEQFLNPLLLQATFGIPYHPWYRGAVEGIATREIAALLKLRHKLSWTVLTHVVMLDRLQRMASADRVERSARSMRRALPKPAFRGLLSGLRKYIARLEATRSGPSSWSGYARENTYSKAEAEHKQRSVREFVEGTGVGMVLDVGCNIGDYAATALKAGATSVIGVEADPETANLAFERAVAEHLQFLPLVVDAANPSPAQGWQSLERRSFADRGKFDGVIALAFEHHLAIGRNIPLDQLVGWLVGLAPRGIIEFVPKDDPTIQRMLALREDIFLDYSAANFESLLSGMARVTRKEQISATGRALFWFDRS